MRRMTTCLLTCVIVFFAANASAQQATEKPFMSVGGNLGLLIGPAFGGGLDFGFDANFFLTDRISIGPWMQLGVASKSVILLTTVNTRYYIDAFDGGPGKKLQPFLQGGLGLEYDKINGAKGDVDFLINLGAGLEYALNDNLYFGSDIMFNTIPTAPFGLFNITWQFAALRYRF